MSSDLTTSGASEAGAVQFGGRRLQGLAPGLIAEKSTDAVTGAQLFEHSKPVTLINGTHGTESSKDENQKFDLISGASIVMVSDENVSINFKQKHEEKVEGEKSKIVPNLLAAGLNKDLNLRSVTLKRDSEGKPASTIKLEVSDDGDLMTTKNEDKASFGTGGVKLTKVVTTGTLKSALDAGALTLSNGTVNTKLSHEGLIFAAHDSSNEAGVMANNGQLTLKAAQDQNVVIGGKNVLLGEGAALTGVNLPVKNTLDFGDGKQLTLKSSSSTEAAGSVAFGNRRLLGIAPGRIEAQSADGVTGGVKYLNWLVHLTSVSNQVH